MNVSITEARAKLSELVRRAKAGEEIVITRRGKAVARLLPPLPKGAFFATHWRLEGQYPCRRRF
ncbi:type II toxin-antitoxin system prevent-host-death family antitoxin [Mesorhizobium sp. VK22B]|uniref:Antitoxin n=1 Tax=Mesorhizobium captivum TaxID=3072319 RepID=A0ABU4Z7L1_9HYPH|nr:type II toxin-antitoxin system prevent-host-death family antitoxin [Mesorhizobium sp. VK22B]MDX8495265.1 type II toxin-antitoxin system prevent-host-death family antitoxin [Mesorhizobium sp. VK22B]